MARIRSVKPEFFQDEDLAVEVPSRDARLLYIGLWGLADEHGRLRGNSTSIKGELFAYDDDLTPEVIDKLIGMLVDTGRAIRYQVRSSAYLFLPKLAKNQRLEPSKVPSRLPLHRLSRDNTTAQTSPGTALMSPRPTQTSCRLSKWQVASGKWQVASGRTREAAPRGPPGAAHAKSRRPNPPAIHPAKPNASSPRGSHRCGNGHKPRLSTTSASTSARHWPKGRTRPTSPKR